MIPSFINNIEVVKDESDYIVMTFSYKEGTEKTVVESIAMNDKDIKKLYDLIGKFIKSQSPIG